MPLHVYAPFQSMLYVNPFVGINFKVSGQIIGNRREHRRLPILPDILI